MAEYLCFDALNWLGKFWCQKRGRQSPWNELSSMRRKVASFVRACRKAGFTVVVVIDETAMSQEAVQKWMRRRARELSTDERFMPLGIDALYAEAFQQAGVQVFRPTDADADDVLASLAAHHAGSVVSMDRDFFRYVPPVKVIRGFTIRGDRLQLDPPVHMKPIASERRIDPDLAVSVAPGTSETSTPAFIDGMLVRRGVSSSSDRLCQSLHLLSRPLLAAVLHVTGVKSVLQELPRWDEDAGRVVWDVEPVSADASFAHVLDDVCATKRWLEEQDVAKPDGGWRQIEREFNRCIVAADFHARAVGGTLTELLRKCENGSRWR